MGIFDDFWGGYESYQYVASAIVSPRLLMMYRAIVFIWSFSYVLYHVIKLTVRTLDFISYVLLVMYFGVALVATYKHRIMYNQVRDYQPYLWQRLGVHGIHKLMSVLLEIVAPLTLVSTVGYASMILPHDDVTITTALHMYVFSSVMVCGELLFSQMHMKSMHVVVFVVFVGIYLGVAAAAGHKWNYEFLKDRQTSKWAYPVTLVLCAGMYVVCLCIVRLRQRYSGVLSSLVVPQSQDQRWLSSDENDDDTSQYETSSGAHYPPYSSAETSSVYYSTV